MLLMMPPIGGPLAFHQKMGRLSAYKAGKAVDRVLPTGKVYDIVDGALYSVEEYKHHCLHCSKIGKGLGLVPKAEFVESLGIYKGPGCSKCNNTGFQMRVDHQRVHKGKYPKREKINLDK